MAQWVCCLSIDPSQCFLSTRLDGAVRTLIIISNKCPSLLEIKNLCSSFGTKHICWDHRSLAEAQCDSCRSMGHSCRGGRGAQQSHRTAGGPGLLPQPGPWPPSAFPLLCPLSHHLGQVSSHSSLLAPTTSDSFSECPVGGSLSCHTWGLCCSSEVTQWLQW